MEVQLQTATQECWCCCLARQGTEFPCASCPGGNPSQAGAEVCLTLRVRKGVGMGDRRGQGVGGRSLAAESLTLALNWSQGSSQSYRSCLPPPSTLYMNLR